MDNYNERLYEIINYAYEGEVGWIHDQLDGTSVMDDAIKRIEDEKAKTKQAITSLIKELVADAKPDNPYKTSYGLVPKGLEDSATAHDVAIKDFEQNLLKELEEV